MKILVLHHFSDYWDYSLKNFNTNYEKEKEKVIDYLKNNEIDKVIITNFEGCDFEECHFDLIRKFENNISFEVYKYGYGWTRDNFSKKQLSKELFNKTWTYGKRDHHDGKNDILIIEDWQHDLKGHEVFIAGAFEGACINDLETVLEAIDCDYKKIDSLTVGTGVDYVFLSKNIDEIVAEIVALIDDFSSDIEDLVEDYQDKEYYKIPESENYHPDIKDLYQIYPEKIIEIEEKIKEIFEKYREYEDEIKEVYFEMDNEILKDFINEYLETTIDFDFFKNEMEPLESKYKKEIIDLITEEIEFYEDITEGKELLEIEEEELNTLIKNIKNITNKYKDEDFFDDMNFKTENGLVDLLLEKITAKIDMSLYLQMLTVSSCFKYNETEKYHLRGLKL